MIQGHLLIAPLNDFLVVLYASPTAAGTVLCSTVSLSIVPFITVELSTVRHTLTCMLAVWYIADHQCLGEDSPRFGMWLLSRGCMLKRAHVQEKYGGKESYAK